MKNILVLSILFVSFLGLHAQNEYENMSNREWWNALSPSWKTIIQKQYLKGKQIDPTDEQLTSILTVKQIDCIDEKGIKSLKPLVKFPNLEILDCSNTGIESLEGVQSLPALKELYCSDNDNINSLKPLENLLQLERLHCGNTMVKDLRPLQNHVNLKVLDLHYCVVSDLIFLSKLRSLEVLNVSKNASLFKLDGIEELKNLAVLNIANTKISTLDPIKDLPNIQMLNISGTQIKSLRSISTKGYRDHLKKLSFSDTKITGRSLDYLVNHYSMEQVRAKGNMICPTDIEEFLKAHALVNPNSKVLITPSKDANFLNDKCK